MEIHVFHDNGEFTEHTVIEVTRAWLTEHCTDAEFGVEKCDVGMEKEHHNTDGRVHVQEILRGGFTVTVGPKDKPEEVELPAGVWAIFQDDEGIGHASRIFFKDLGNGMGCERHHQICDEKLPIPA